MRKLLLLIFSALLISYAGCADERLPQIKDYVKIQINVPAERPPTSKTQLVTSDLQKDREIFLNFYRATKKIGMCSPSALKEALKAHKVMSVTYWGEGIEDHICLTILKTDSGKWLSTGYGSVEVYDVPTGFPKYEYSRRQLKIIREWYKRNADQFLRPELLRTEPFRIKIPEIKAAISIWYYAHLLKHEPIGEGQELYVFDVGALSVDDVDKYKRALIGLGWIAQGSEKHISKEWPVTEEYVFRKKDKQMSFWAGGSIGMGMVGIKVPK